MKNLFLRRLLSFIVDFFVWISLFYVWVKINPMIYIGKKTLTIGDIYYLTSFLFFILIYYFVSYWKFNGFSIGNYIFKLKIVNLKGDKISWKQSLLRVALLIFDFFSMYVLNFNNTKKNQYQSFVERYTYTACVGYETNKKDYPKPLEVKKIKYGVFITIFIISIIGFIMTRSFLLDLNKSIQEIKSEFVTSINKNLKDNNLLDKEKNKLIPDCIWNKDEQIGGYPYFVIELYWSDKKNRKEVLNYLNELFQECVIENYPKDYFKKLKTKN